MTDDTDISVDDAVDAGPVPAHLLLEVDGDSVEIDDGDEPDSSDTGPVSEATDAGPPPDDLMVLADDRGEDVDQVPDDEPNSA